MISPESAFLFRDGGREGDAVSRDVVRALPEHLEEGAFGSVLISWVVPSDGDWSAPLRWWVSGRGCDAWFLHYGTSDPLTHAANWLRHDLGGDPEAFAAALDRWLVYFDRLGIEGIATGAVVLRRRTGVNWMRADRIPADRLRPAGEQIQRIFAAGDVLSAMRDERQLLAERVALAPRALLEQRAVLLDGEWDGAGAILRLEEGLGFEASLDGATAGLLASLDGRRTVADVAADLARLDGTSREVVEQAALPIVAELLASGFLELRVPRLMPAPRESKPRLASVQAVDSAEDGAGPRLEQPGLPVGPRPAILRRKGEAGWVSTKRGRDVSRSGRRWEASPSSLSSWSELC